MMLCLGAGIGIQDGLKIRWAYALEGSSPSRGTYIKFMKFESLPQLETQPVKERSPEYIKRLEEIERVMGEGEEEQRKYIKQRLEDLTNNSKAGEISHIGKRTHEGFLGPKMKIRRNMIVDPFVMDDPNLYVDFFETIQKLRKTKGWEEKSLKEIMPSATQATLSKYFGNIIGGTNAEANNREFYLDHTSADSPEISIKELKGKGIAVCAEKGAAAQNLLAFIGLESDFIASSNCRIPAEEKESAHYFILVHGPKADIIYDPTNPRMILDKDNNLVSYSPAMYPITEDQSKNLISGENVIVEHVDDKISDDGQRVPDKSNRLYARLK